MPKESETVLPDILREKRKSRNVVPNLISKEVFIHLYKLKYHLQQPDPSYLTTYTVNLLSLVHLQNPNKIPPPPPVLYFFILYSQRKISVTKSQVEEGVVLRNDVIFV